MEFIFELFAEMFGGRKGEQPNADIDGAMMRNQTAEPEQMVADEMTDAAQETEPVNIFGMLNFH